MTIFGEDDRPQPRRVHEIGQDLTMLSVAEIDLRIAALHDEIVRLEQARLKKDASRLAAENVFRKSG